MYPENVSLYEAQRALEENVSKHIKKDAMPVLHNQNIALLGIVQALQRLDQNVDLLHNKIQPILKEIMDDANYARSVVRGKEN